MAKVHVKQGRVQPIANRHPWLFAGSVAGVDGDPAPGDVVDVLDPRGRFLGRGFYNASSQIRVRLFAYERAVEPGIDFFRERVARAQLFRKSALGLPAPGATDAYRAIHSEADGLPGLVVDRYGDVLVAMISHVGIERRKDLLVQALVEAYSPAAIVERDDPEYRKLEGLEPADAVLWHGGGGCPESVEIRELGVGYRVDLAGGQKTGHYLDQRTNRALVGRLADDRRVLDVFSYTGAFALNAARSARVRRRIVALESSKAASERAAANADANALAAIEFVTGDAYKFLGGLRSTGERFDLVVVDPPAYASGSGKLDKALQKYLELNALALGALDAGGILVTCSCSGAVSESDFEGVVSAAAVRAGRRIRIFQRAGQAPDHPVSPHCPEGRYLKVLFCHAE